MLPPAIVDPTDRGGPPGDDIAHWGSNLLRMLRASWRRHVWHALLVLTLAGVAFFGWSAWRVWQAWRSVERVEFDLTASRAALPASPQAAPVDPTTELDELLDVFLVIGSDAKPEASGVRADVLMLFIKPTDGATPILVSVPRDLYVPSPCDGELRRINANLAGCGPDVSGPELISLAVEDYTGVPVDHFVTFGLDGFEKVIDKVGGIEVCVPNPLRHDFEDLLPAGCTVADGATTLLWIRSRTTTELVDGEWVPLEDEGDLARNVRQQHVLMQMLAKLDQFRSPHTFSRLVEDLSDAFLLDKGLSLGDAVGHAWDLRGLDPDGIKRPVIQVEGAVTDDGEFVVVPVGPFGDVLAEAYPPAAAYLPLGEAP